MALKPIVESLDAVPEALRSEYTERDGKFHLAVEGMVPRDRVDEFRTNNLTLKRQLDELAAKYDGIDPEAHKELAAQAAKLREKQLIDAGKVDELVNERISVMRGEHDKTVKGLTDREAALRTQLEGLVIDNALRAAAAELGVRPQAVDDVLLRGKMVFRLDGGNAVAMEGDKPMYGKNGEALGIAEWVGSLTNSAPHLFTPSNGGGSNNQSGGAGRGAGRVSKTDQKAFLANLGDIAKGKIVVGA